MVRYFDDLTHHNHVNNNNSNDNVIDNNNNKQAKIRDAGYLLQNEERLYEKLIMDALQKAVRNRNIGTNIGFHGSRHNINNRFGGLMERYIPVFMGDENNNNNNININN